MTTAVLAALYEQREETCNSMEAVLTQCEGRDLTDAEKTLLTSTRERLELIDAQIEPLAAYEAMRDAHHATSAQLAQTSSPAAQARPVGAVVSRMEYRSAGQYVVDYMRANGIFDRGYVDSEAAARLLQVRADQTTADTPGLLPTPIVGQVVSLLDANRPIIQSLGGTKALGNIPGTTFTRPKVTVHTQVGAQTAEKTALPSRKMTVAPQTFTKSTLGGYVDISRQDIDWSNPSAWDVLINDLAAEYAVQTETAVAAAFATAATGTKPPPLPASPVLADWTKGLYTAAMHSYSAGQRMPAAVWVSLDVWAALGSLVDTTRVVFPPDTGAGGVDQPLDSWDSGGSSMATMRGDILGLPRIVAPYLPSKTCIVGPTDLYEVYEENIGLLSVIEPSILGVQVAYGGYLAYGTLAGTAYVPLDLSAVTSLPTMAELGADDEAAAEPEPETQTRSRK
jgi:HK97 family phage major capsid protein